MQHSINQLNPHLCVAQSRIYATNSGIFIIDDQACLIDPGVFPDEIAAIADFVRAQGAEPQTIILTHSHWDHIFGPEGFPGVKTAAQANYSHESSGKAGAATLQQIEDFFKEHDIPRARPFVIPQADITFEKEFSLTVGDLSLKLIHAPGHRSDQMVIYHSGSGVLWSADMLSDTDVPFVCESLLTYEQTLEKLSRIEIQLLVPGHGQPAVGTEAVRKRISEDVAYLQALHEHVDQAVRAGKSAAETVAACADINRRLGEENEDTHKNNVESAYLELGGAAESEEIGWKKIFP